MLPGDEVGTGGGGGGGDDCDEILTRRGGGGSGGGSQERSTRFVPVAVLVVDVETSRFPPSPFKRDVRNGLSGGGLLQGIPTGQRERTPTSLMQLRPANRSNNSGGAAFGMIGVSRRV